MFKSPQTYAQEFKARQNCHHIWSDDGLHLIFENGARIALKNERGEDVVEGEVEPPFRDEEDTLRRQLTYWRIMHSREAIAWSDFHQKMLKAAGYAASAEIINWLPPNEAELAQIDAGKKRCEDYAAKVAEISEQILALPRFVELRRLKAQAKADHAALKSKAQAIVERLATITVPRPEAFQNVELEQ